MTPGIEGRSRSTAQGGRRAVGPDLIPDPPQRIRRHLVAIRLLRQLVPRAGVGTGYVPNPRAATAAARRRGAAGTLGSGAPARRWRAASNVAASVAIAKRDA